MSGVIFLVRGDELVELRPSSYANEDLLQELIARFPGVLAGEQDGVANRWLLISREAGLPGTEDGHDRWAVDHLFLDQDAVPTLVEVKLARDTRIRREVVGQMLDYASNAVVYWPIDRLRELYLRQCQLDGHDPDQLLAAVAGQDADVERFWGRAEENLRAGKLRLVFVADEIPRELRRIIEFLNGQMNADVLGIEVKQYLGGELTTLVPSIVGQTAEAEARKRRTTASPTRQWDEASLFAQLAELTSPAEVELVRVLYDRASELGWQTNFGTGANHGSWKPTIARSTQSYRPLTVYGNGAIEFPLRSLATRPPFDSSETRRHVLEYLNQLPGASFDESWTDRYPQVRTGEIGATPTTRATLLELLDWFDRTTQP